ncbi:hypothetical protein OG871_35235 [Kitasatospora sp. NBC_00374]|uniref:hypothetical protein n=1 Tax=Kitasatospora sp. NBC_00374 TaxID=2975964 RepID=UPI0030E4DD1C
MTGPRYEARFSGEVARAVRALADEDRARLRRAVARAEADPWSWPQADRYDLDDTVRVVTAGRAMVHYAILPEPPHLWVFALTAL